MESNQINKLINNLNSKQKQEFAISCFERVLFLYSYFDKNEDISLSNTYIKKGTAFFTLKSIYQIIKKPSTIKKEILIEKKSLCESLIIDIENIYDNTTENEVCMLVAQILYDIINFILTSETKFIHYCSTNTIEIINQIYTNKYFELYEDDEELEDFLEKYFIKEYSIQIKSIEYLMNNKDLNKIIDENKITY